MKLLPYQGQLPLFFLQLQPFHQNSLALGWVGGESGSIACDGFLPPTVAVSAALLFVIPDTMSNGFHHTAHHGLCYCPPSVPAQAQLTHGCVFSPYDFHLLQGQAGIIFGRWQGMGSPQRGQTSDTWSLVTAAQCSDMVTGMDGHTGQWHSLQPSTCTATTKGASISTVQQVLL